MPTTTEKLAMKIAEILTANEDTQRHAVALLSSINEETTKEYVENVDKYFNKLKDYSPLEFKQDFQNVNTNDLNEGHIRFLVGMYSCDDHDDYHTPTDSSEYLCVGEITEKIKNNWGKK